jgi:hypothetical protein
MSKAHGLVTIYRFRSLVRGLENNRIFSVRVHLYLTIDELERNEGWKMKR